MILSCNSCEKKFVIPDNAIGPSGRLVQCSSCGNKWRQLPVIAEKRSPNKTTTKAKEKISKINKKNKEIKIIKKKVKKKKDGPNLYSPEYLAKKHGINLNEINLIKKEKKIEYKNNVHFGFYNLIIFYTLILIFLSRTLFFLQDIIVINFPATEFYINYFFESIRNIFEIVKNLITNY